MSSNKYKQSYRKSESNGPKIQIQYIFCLESNYTWNSFTMKKHEKVLSIHSKHKICIRLYFCWIWNLGSLLNMFLYVNWTIQVVVLSTGNASEQRELHTTIWLLHLLWIINILFTLIWRMLEAFVSHRGWNKPEWMNYEIHKNNKNQTSRWSEQCFCSIAIKRRNVLSMLFQFFMVFYGLKLKLKNGFYFENFMD